MRVGIYTHYSDKYPKSALSILSIYQVKLIEKVSKFRNIGNGGVRKNE